MSRKRAAVICKPDEPVAESADLKTYEWPQVVSSKKILIPALGGVEITAPALEGLAFIGRGGWLGFRCVCGHVVSGRSMASLEQGMIDHQAPTTCTEYERYAMPDVDNV